MGASSGPAVRRAIGIIGIGLPFVLLAGGVPAGVGRQTSISAYYYTALGAVFVGSLCAQGALLLCVRGRPRETVAAYLAGVLVIAVALLPTSPVDPTPAQSGVGVAHLICATGYYLTMAFCCLAGFPMATRNPFHVTVYRSCGGAVLVALPLAALTGAPFWFEAFAGVAIGTAWLLRACEPGLMIGSDSG